MLFFHVSHDIIYWKESHFERHKVFRLIQSRGYLPEDAACLVPARPCSIFECEGLKIWATIWQDNDCVHLRKAKRV